MYAFRGDIKNMSTSMLEEVSKTHVSIRLLHKPTSLSELQLIIWTRVMFHVVWDSFFIRNTLGRLHLGTVTYVLYHYFPLQRTFHLWWTDFEISSYFFSNWVSPENGQSCWQVSLAPFLTECLEIPTVGLFNLRCGWLEYSLSMRYTPSSPLL